jgi:hypothetical protein
MRSSISGMWWYGVDSASSGSDPVADWFDDKRQGNSSRTEQLSACSAYSQAYETCVTFLYSVPRITAFWKLGFLSNTSLCSKSKIWPVAWILMSDYVKYTVDELHTSRDHETSFSNKIATHFTCTYCDLLWNILLGGHGNSWRQYSNFVPNIGFSLL